MAKFSPLLPQSKLKDKNKTILPDLRMNELSRRCQEKCKEFTWSNFYEQHSVLNTLYTFLYLVLIY